MLTLFCKISSAAVSLLTLPSLVLSISTSSSAVSMVLRKFEGRRAVDGLYLEDGFVAGGGIEMLALPIFPSTVPASAKRLFRLGTGAF